MLLVAMLAAVLSATMPGFSGATYTTRTTNPASTVSAAVDWTPPTVSLAATGTPVKDTVTLSATAADGETGVANVMFQYQSAGGSWTTLCTVATAPYTCGWNTKLVADGATDLRAIATDNAGYSTLSSTVSTTVANNTLVVLTDPGDTVRGTTPLATTLYNSGSLTYTVKVEYSVAGVNNWKNLCTNLSSPYSCSWNTGTLGNGFYDLRSTATSGSTSYTSAVVTDVLVDNGAPAVSMTDPGTPLRGTVTVAATASDADSGVAQVVLQYALNGTSTWKDICTVAVAPYSCRFDTTTIADGTYGVRAVATDVAGNTSTSTVVANRVVDNTVSAVSMEDPGAFLRGTATLGATASSSAGVGSVKIQYAAGGTSTWTDVCTDTTAPYSCAWDTTKVADGLYDFRAVLVDGRGTTTTSATVSGKRVDNGALRAADVQTANGTGTVSKLDAGDTVTFTYSEQVAPASVTSGWTGSSLAVQLRLRDGNLLGLGNSGDSFDVLRTGGSVNLGAVNTNGDYIKTSKTATFSATMVMGSRVVGGITQTTVTITVGALVSGGATKTPAAASAMVWTPLAAVTDLAGNGCSTAPVTETGTADREF